MVVPYRTSVGIAAPPEAVYPYLTRPEAIVSWMGDHAVLDAVPGGLFHLDINGVPVRGRSSSSRSCARTTSLAA